MFEVAVLGGEGGAAVPALVVPSCQKEGFVFVNDCIVALLRVVKEELAPHCVVATGCDGASSARKAEKLRLQCELSDSLKAYLPHCIGLDLRVAQGDIVQSPDTNHAAIKRVASWLRRGAGIYIEGYTVNPSFLEGIVATYETRARAADAAPPYLPAAPATATGDFAMLTPEVMHSLLFTSDAMSTEYALKLLRAVSLLDKSFAPLAQDAAVTNALHVVSRVCTVIVSFVTPVLKKEGKPAHPPHLQAQLGALSELAHFLHALFIKDGHRTSFMPSELYYDLQMMCRNAYILGSRAITHAKARGSAFLLVLLEYGSDDCERLFSTTRTLDHSVNMSVLHFGRRAGIAVSIEEAFQRQPHLRRQVRSREQHTPVSLLDPAHYSVTGKETARFLPDLWEVGKEAAQQALTALGWDALPVLSAGAGFTTAPFPAAAEYEGEGAVLGPYFDAKAQAAEGEARAEEEAAAGPALEGDDDLGQLDDLLDGASGGDAQAPAPGGGGGGGAAPPSPQRLRLTLPGGKLVHVACATKEIFYPATSVGNTKGNPVNDRLARVAGKFDGLGSTTLGPGEQADSLLTIGDYIITLACPKGSGLPHLLLLLVQRIDVGAARVFSLEEGVDANVHGVVRVLRPQPPPSTSWRVCGPGFMGKIASFAVSSGLMMPLNPDVAFGPDGVAVHSVAEPDLKLAVEALAGRFAAGSAALQTFSVPPVVWPYVDRDGGFPFISLHNAEAIAAQMEEDARANWTQCKVCDKWGLRSAARLHIGTHALEQAAAACSLATAPREPPNFCGSCGATPPCDITLQQASKRKAIKIASKCSSPPLNFNYAAALNLSTLDPTANIPIKCPECDAAIWRRNAQHHFTEAHVGTPLPKELDLGAGDKAALFSAVEAATARASRSKAAWRSGSGPTFPGPGQGQEVGVQGAGRGKQQVVLRGWSHHDEGKRVWIQFGGGVHGGRAVGPEHEAINLSQLGAWAADRERDARTDAGEKSPTIALALFPARDDKAEEGGASLRLGEWWPEVALTKRAPRGNAREQLGGKGSDADKAAAGARVERVRALVREAAAARIAPRRAPPAAGAGGKRKRGAGEGGEAEGEGGREEEGEGGGEEEGEEVEVEVVEEADAGGAGAAAAAAVAAARHQARLAAADAASRSAAAAAAAAMVRGTHAKTAGCCSHACTSSCCDDDSACPHWV